MRTLALLSLLLATQSRVETAERFQELYTSFRLESHPDLAPEDEESLEVFVDMTPDDAMERRTAREILYYQSKAEESAAAMEAKLAKLLAMPAEAVEPLMVALMSEYAVAAAAAEERDAIMRRVIDAYELAIARSQGHPAAIAEMVLFLTMNHDLAADLPGALARLKSRGGVAGALAVSRVPTPANRGVLDDDLRERFCNDPLFLQSLGEGSWNPIVDAAVLDVLLTGERAKSIDKQIAPLLASRRLFNLLRIGEAAEAVAMFEQLPEEQRAAIKAGSLAIVERTIEGIPFRVSPYVVRNHLAAAYLLAGQPPKAAAIAPESKSPEEEPELYLLKAFRTGEPADTFEVIANGLQHADRALRRHLAWSRLWGEYAARAKQPEFAATTFEIGAESLREWIGEAEAMKVRISPEIDQRVAARIAQSRELAAALEEKAAALRGRKHDTAKASRAAPRVKQLALEKERVSTRAEQARDVKLSDQEQMRFGFTSVARLERNGAEQVAIIATRDVDPVEGPGRGGYWITRSTDEGESWSPPLYTGLRELDPWYVVPRSRVALANDVVRLEAELREIDRSSLGLVIPRYSRRSRGHVLEIALEELTRDSDSDGLTDLLESALLTKGDDADSDDDGVNDGADLNPRVPAGDKASVKARVIEAVLQHMAGKGIDESVIPRQRTLFVTGDPSDYQAIQPALRLIVMSESERDAMANAIGPLLRSPEIVIDASGRRAFVRMSEGFTGWCYRVTKSESGWTAERFNHWVEGRFTPIW